MSAASSVIFLACLLPAVHPGSAAESTDTRVYFVRHGLALHNVIGPGHCQDEEFLDPPLVSEGRRQALDLGHHLGVTGLVVDVIYSSPLLRALETTSLLRRAAWGDLSGRPVAVPPPVIVLEGLRESGSACTADWRRPVSDTFHKFPDFNFSDISSDADPARELESETACKARGAAFLSGLATQNTWGAQQKRRVLIVSHASFLQSMLFNEASQAGEDRRGPVLIPVDAPSSSPLFGNRSIGEIANCEVLSFGIAV